MCETNNCHVVIALTVISLLMAACGDSNSNPPAPVAVRDFQPTTGPESGSLVVAGGNIQDAAIIERFLELAGGPGSPIVVVPTAVEGDIDDLEWTSIGVTSFVPTYHQWILNKSEHFHLENFLTDSDSIYVYPLNANNNSLVAILDPQGRPFKTFQKHYNELHIGPFPLLGHYQILSGEDTDIFAVNLAKPKKMFSQKEYFETMEDFKNQHLIVNPDDAIKTLRGTFHPLWKLFILSAIVFLLLESWISRYFSPKAIQEKKNNLTQRGL